MNLFKLFELSRYDTDRSKCTQEKAVIFFIGLGSFSTVIIVFFKNSLVLSKPHFFEVFKNIQIVIKKHLYFFLFVELNANANVKFYVSRKKISVAFFNFILQKFNDILKSTYSLEG